MRQPTRAPVAGLPQAVTIYEVGPRDGLQNESAVVPTATKAQFIRQLVQAGLTTVETTSFVHPDWVPQLADADELLRSVGRIGEVRMPVLVPNERGLDRALAADVRDIAVFASATETFAQRNLNRSYESQWAMFEPVVELSRNAGIGVRGYLSMCFGDPWEGAVDPEQVVDAALRLVDMGCDELSLGDTIGVATPGQVLGLLEALVASGIDLGTVAVHFHDTYGQALANTLAALQAGVTTVDASAGGLGGCPFAESATGNLATEDLVWMLAGLGVDTGVNLEALVSTSVWMAQELGRPSPSRVVTALGGARER